MEEARKTPLSAGDASGNKGSGRFKKGSMALEVIRSYAAQQPPLLQFVPLGCTTLVIMAVPLWKS
jgi:hypothetical protein